MRILAILPFFLIISCAMAPGVPPSYMPGVDGRDGRDGSNGRDGSKGDKGDTGQAGTSCKARQVQGGVNVECGDNEPVFISDGIDGIDGANGSGCVVLNLDPSLELPYGGVLMSCGESTALIRNGISEVPSSQVNVLGVVNPCGVNGPWDEVLLRLDSGDLVALYAENGSALRSRLVFVRDDVNLETTDGYHCKFRLSTSSNGFRTIRSTSPVVLEETWPVN